MKAVDPDEIVVTIVARLDLLVASASATTTGAVSVHAHVVTAVEAQQ
jgi:hypothetical protein